GESGLTTRVADIAVDLEVLGDLRIRMGRGDILLVEAFQVADTFTGSEGRLGDVSQQGEVAEAEVRTGAQTTDEMVELLLRAEVPEGNVRPKQGNASEGPSLGEQLIVQLLHLIIFADAVTVLLLPLD